MRTSDGLRGLTAIKDILERVPCWCVRRVIEGITMVATIRNRRRVNVDRETPLEVQLSQLLREGKIKDTRPIFLTDGNFPSDKIRPTSILLGECSLGCGISKGECPRELLMATPGVARCGDPYELLGLIRAGAKHSIKESLPALDQILDFPPDYPSMRVAPALIFSEICGDLSVDDIFMAGGWHDEWWFLVVCEE